MIICHCEEVSDRTIKHAIAAGATTIDQITESCGAAKNCAGCFEALEALLLNLDRASTRSRVPRWRRHVVAQTA